MQACLVSHQSSHLFVVGFSRLCLRFFHDIWCGLNNFLFFLCFAV